MLVITRMPGEKIRISTNIEVCVLEVDGNDVRLGINAPADVHIHREEIYRRIEKSKKESRNKKRTAPKEPTL